MQQDEWMIAAVSRLQQALEGGQVEYPGRLATCPQGHVRVLPTRFSRSDFQLRCGECGRSYRFREPA